MALWETSTGARIRADNDDEFVRPSLELHAQWIQRLGDLFSSVAVTGDEPKALGVEYGVPMQAGELCSFTERQLQGSARCRNLLSVPGWVYDGGVSSFTASESCAPVT